MSTLASVVGKGVFASRPAAGIAGAIYYSTDTGKIYRDNGATWDDVTPAGGLTNPMTTAGDLIVGGSSGTPARLGVGSSGQVLTVVSGAPAWAAGAAAVISANNLSFSATPVFSAAATKQSITLTANVTGSTLAASTIDGFVTTLLISQDATGGRTFVGPTNALFPAIGTSPNQVTAVTLVYDTPNTRWVTTSVVILG